MFDHFHDRSRVESPKANIPVHQRAVEETNAFALFRRKAIELESRLCLLQDTDGDIHSDDFGELRIGKQPSQELAFTASEIEHP